MPLRDHAGAAVVTTLSANISASDLSITISDATGWPTGGVNGPFFVDINPDGAGEEKVLVTSRTATTLTVAVVGDRGVDGSSASAHNAGVKIRPTWTATEAQEANDHIFDVARDDHTQYMKADGTRHDLTARHSAGTVVPTGSPASVGTVLSDGVAATVARADHVHDLGAGSVDASGLFAAGVIDAAALANLAVTTAKIADLAVTLGKIADLAVSDAKLASNAVTTAKIADGAVTLSKLGSDTFALSIEVTSGGPLETTFANVIGTQTLTPAAGTWLFIGNVATSSSIATTTTHEARIRNTTDNVSLQFRELGLRSATDNNEAVIPLSTVATLAAGKTLVLQARTRGGGGTQLHTSASLVALRLPGVS